MAQVEAEVAPIRAQRREEALRRVEAEVSAAVDARQKEVRCVHFDLPTLVRSHAPL